MITQLERFFMNWRLKKIDGKMAKEKNGVVEEMMLGGKPHCSKIVKGNKVLEFVVGGPAKEVGFVKDGKAYEHIIGGEPRYLGKVRYNK